MDPYIKVTEELFSAAEVSLSILSTFTFIIVHMKRCGKITGDGMLKKFLPGRSYILTVLIINAFLLVMHR